MKLQVLIDEVAKSWPFDESRYPGMKGLSDQQKKAFAIRHIFLHQMKTAGGLATILEQHEHGKDEIDLANIVIAAKLQLAAYKFIQNGLVLSKLLGMSAEDIAKNLVPSKFVHDTAVTKV